MPTPFFRFSVLALGLCALAPAHAEWVKVGEVEAVTLYFDPATLRQEGDIRRIQEMQDLRQRDPDGVLSRQYLNEYDCKHKMHRIGNMTSFAGPQLSGAKLFDIKERGYWRKIPGNGLFSISFERLCNS